MAASHEPHAKVQRLTDGGRYWAGNMIHGDCPNSFPQKRPRQCVLDHTLDSFQLDYPSHASWSKLKTTNCHAVRKFSPWQEATVGMWDEPINGGMLAWDICRTRVQNRTQAERGPTNKLKPLPTNHSRGICSAKPRLYYAFTAPLPRIMKLACPILSSIKSK